MNTNKTPKNATTPPKGRPTRARDGDYGSRKAFGPRLQWVAVILVIVILFLILAIVTNPFGNNGSHTGMGEPVVALLAAVS